MVKEEMMESLLIQCVLNGGNGQSLHVLQPQIQRNPNGGAESGKKGKHFHMGIGSR